MPSIHGTSKTSCSLSDEDDEDDEDESESFVGPDPFCSISSFGFLSSSEDKSTNQTKKMPSTDKKVCFGIRKFTKESFFFCLFRFLDQKMPSVT